MIKVIRMFVEIIPSSAIFVSIEIAFTGKILYLKNFYGQLIEKCVIH